MKEEILAKLGLTWEEAKVMAEEFYAQRDLMTILLATDPQIQMEVQDALRYTDSVGVTVNSEDEVEKRVTTVFCMGYVMAIATGKVSNFFAEKIKSKLAAKNAETNQLSKELSPEDTDWYKKLFGAN